MSNGEIKVVQQDLLNITEEIEQILIEAAQYQNRTALIEQSRGAMADAVNELFTEMKAIERVMEEIIQQTVQALDNAGVQYNRADLIATKMAKSIGGE